MSTFRNKNNNIYFGDRMHYGDIELTPEELDAYNAQREKETRISEIKSRLGAIDNLKIRPVSEIINDDITDKTYAISKLAELETEAAGLRAEYQGLIK